MATAPTSPITWTELPLSDASAAGPVVAFSVQSNGTLLVAPNAPGSAIATGTELVPNVSEITWVEIESDGVKSAKGLEVDVQDFLSEPGHYEAGYYEYSAPYDDEDGSEDPGDPGRTGRSMTTGADACASGMDASVASAKSESSVPVPISERESSVPVPASERIRSFHDIDSWV